MHRMNKLSTTERVQVLNALIEGNSISATVRMTGISKPTILKLIAELGPKCQKFHDEKVRGLRTVRVQCDEIWSFCHCKAKNVKPERKGMLGWGDVWTFTGIDADTKLMISWLVGFREALWANRFLEDVADRLENRVQLTTDGHRMYFKAVEGAFGNDIDYGMLIKLYGQDRAGEARYSPAVCTGYIKHELIGKPALEDISTSFVERSNLTLRMGMRRYTRLTNGHSKKLDNHVAMTAIFMTCYNWCRRHQTLKGQTPAMAAKLTDRKWELAELVEMLMA